MDESRRVDATSGSAPDAPLDLRLREVNELFQAIWDQGLFAGRITLDGTLIDANRSSLEVCGYKRDDVIGKPFWECGWWNRSDDVKKWCRDAVMQAISGVPFRGESRYFWADGSEHIVDFACMPVRDAGGNVIVVVPTGMDITEQVRADNVRLALEKERQRSEALAELDRARNEFLTTLSHELRTPMTSTLGWASLLRTGRLSAEETKHAAAAIEQSTREQAKLIDDILDVSRISMGKVRLQLAPVSLGAIVESVVAAIRPVADSKSQSIELTAADLGGSVLGDAGRIGQIVRNLLSNAVKFTPNGGRIRVSVGLASAAVAEVIVSDDGEGISAEFLPFVFDRFRQAESGLRRTHGGLGLGLSIVKDLTELHGGSVSAASEGPGRGASFAIRFPLMESATIVNPGGTASEALSELRGLHVLLVEDDHSTRQMLETILRLLGADVVTTSSAAEAMGMIRAGDRTVVVSDISMPGEDGFTFVTRLRASENGGARLPVIALTANARAEDRERALSSGFDAFLTKPIEIRQLADEIRRLSPDATL